jgi:hypothetical protein
VAGSGAPRAAADLHIVDLRQGEAAPFALRRQAGLALSGKLICESDLPAIFMAEDMGANLAVEPW